MRISFPSGVKPFIAEASLARIIQGYPDGTFRAENTITRSEMTVMLVRAAKLLVAEGSLSASGKITVCKR
ncbi:S-layer homology domain-containing protein [Paenibacillus abyssi]|uniref:S-layer homology domain-containing protein n=1 Tax=Paenibacillus abyssi TaxID=1340531 RepID=UPI003570EA36